MPPPPRHGMLITVLHAKYWSVLVTHLLQSIRRYCYSLQVFVLFRGHPFFFCFFLVGMFCEWFNVEGRSAHYRDGKKTQQQQQQQRPISNFTPMINPTYRCQHIFRGVFVAVSFTGQADMDNPLSTENRVLAPGRPEPIVSLHWSAPNSNGLDICR